MKVVAQYECEYETRLPGLKAAFFDQLVMAGEPLYLWLSQDIEDGLWRIQYKIGLPAGEEDEDEEEVLTTAPHRNCAVAFAEGLVARLRERYPTLAVTLNASDDTRHAPYRLRAMEIDWEW